MKPQPILVDAMVTPIMEILETFGYDTHTLWGNMYPDFMFIVRFYRKHGVSLYDPETTKGYVQAMHNRYKNKEISRSHYMKQRKAASRIDEFYLTGTLKWSCNKRETKFILNREYNRLLESFLASRDFHQNTKWDFAWAVRKYLFYFQQKGIHSLGKVTVGDVRQFIAEVAATVSDGSLHNLLCYLRQFHMFLREIGEPAPDCVALLSYPVPRKMPVRSYVTDDELRRIMEQIDTSTSKGQRDKAMLSLGAITGLRAVDIVRLKLSDIDRYRGEVHVVQSKTGGLLSLPILPETGEAIKDYILNGRPTSNCPEVFLREKAPFQAMFDGVAIGYVFDQYAKKAGIERHAFDGKGFHVLRRRLARNMLVTGTPVTTIAQVLGHESIETAKQYLSLDSQNLKECALDFSGIPLERGSLL